MVDKIQHLSSANTHAPESVAKPAAPAASSPAAPLVANTSAAPLKKALKKSSARAKSSAKKVKKLVSKNISAAEKATQKNLKTMKSVASAAPLGFGGTKAFDSVLKSSEAFFTFKPNTQTMETLMNQSKNQMDKLANDAAAFSRDGIEACIKSSNLWMKGVEDIMRTAMSLAQTSAEKQGKFVKEALASKTLNEWAEVQNKIAQTNFDDFMSGATKISELSVKVLSECAEPVNAQTTKAVKKVTEVMAA